MTVRTRKDVTIVKNAIRRLEALIDEDNQLCSVRGSHKRAVRPYVDCWVLPELRKLLREEDR